MAALSGFQLAARRLLPKAVPLFFYPLLTALGLSSPQRVGFRASPVLTQTVTASAGGGRTNGIVGGSLTTRIGFP